MRSKYRVSGTGHFTSRIQVEDVKLSKKVLYYFAIDSIIKEILIFENCWIRAYPPDRQIQALNDVRSSRVSRRARNWLLRQWLRLLRTNGAVGARRLAGRAYIVERLHLAVGQVDIPSFSDFQKLISR